jgi:D-amino-acid dehydrogenase
VSLKKVDHLNAAVSDRPRIIVIGAGIVGALCAAYLQRDGAGVTILEANEPAGGASQGNAGAISPGSCIPLSMPGVLRRAPSWLLNPAGPLIIRKQYLPHVLPWLFRFVAAGGPARINPIADALRALHGCVHDCYRPILQDAAAEGMIRKSGSLVVYRSTAGFEAASAEWEMRRIRGVDFEVLAGPELRRTVPALSSDFQHAVLQPDHGYVVDPRALVVQLIDSLRARGIDFVRGEAIRIARENGDLRVVQKNGNLLKADRIVVAAGVWSKPLLANLGFSVPLESQRGYHLHLPDAGIDLPMPVAFSDSKFYATPMDTGLRLAGTVEFAGVSAPPDYARARQLGGLAKKWLPDLDLRGAREWMGHRPCLPDSLPMIGPLPGDPRILLAVGHGHNGMTSAPATGRMIADMIAGRKPFIDAKPYRPDRFQWRRTPLPTEMNS